MPRRRLPRGTQTFETELELPIVIEYSMSAPEPDTGYAGGTEIEGVTVYGVSIDLSDEQLDDIAAQIEESHISAYEDAADQLYRERREEEE